MAIENLITEHIDIWTSAIQSKSSSGRGSSKKMDLYGIKKLRELILELAVRGKLVPQDPNDEPASVLLKRISAKKHELVNSGLIKKPKKLSKISEEEIPFKIPQTWIWTRIQNVGHDLGQKKPNEKFTYIDVGAINKELGVIEDPNILEAADAPSRARKLIKKGTVIYSTVRPYLLNIAVIDHEIFPEPIASTAFAIIHPLDGVLGSYIYRYLRSPSFITYVESVQNGVAYPAINDKQFFIGLIPIPPEKEQHRIVAKVDELMALCDQLEQQTEASIEAHQVLVETLLATLTNSADADELMENWQRISTHFDTLFTTEASIDQLKQRILQLAVMGKLVPQDPNDEPASVLLDRIAEEKAQLVKDGKIKRQKALPPIADDEKPFELPNGWEWCRFSEAIDVRDGTHDSPKDAEGEDTFPLVTSKNFVNGDIDFENARRISAQDHFEIVKRSDVSKYDILFSMIGGNIGNQVMVKYDRQFSIKNVALFKYYDKELTSPDFVFLFTQNLANTLQDSASGGAQPFVSLGVLRNLLFPIPPVEEQKRIVAKIAVLIEICEQLQASIKDAQTTQLHLTDAIIEQVI
jgi:type I restriction enzyme, S subunit